jgi:hypothetical protein
MGSVRGKHCSSGGGEIEDEDVGEFVKLLIGFRICRISSSRYSSVNCLIWSFSFISVVVEVDVDDTTLGKVLLLAIVAAGNVDGSASSTGSV